MGPVEVDCVLVLLVGLARTAATSFPTAHPVKTARLMRTRSALTIVLLTALVAAAYASARQVGVVYLATSLQNAPPLANHRVVLATLALAFVWQASLVQIVPMHCAQTTVSDMVFVTEVLASVRKVGLEGFVTATWTTHLCVILLVALTGNVSVVNAFAVLATPASIALCKWSQCRRSSQRSLPRAFLKQIIIEFKLRHRCLQPWRLLSHTGCRGQIKSKVSIITRVLL